MTLATPATVRTRDLTRAKDTDGESWVGRHVFFRVQDAFLPPPQELMASLFGATVLEGDVVAESRADAEAQAPQSQLVVSVGRLNQLVVVHRSLLLEEVPGGGDTADKEGRHE